MKENLITVIIPAYNEEDVIAKAINSVLESTCKNYEIIVVNNGSTDRTKKIVEEFVRKYPKKIRLLNFNPVTDKEQAKCRGAAFSRNRGVEMAKGGMLFFLDADDWLREDTLENTVKAFERYDVDFICADRKVNIPKNWRRIFIYHYILFKDKIALKTKDSKPEIITNKPNYCPYMIKTKKFKEIGGFNEKYYYNEDYEFYQRLQRLNISTLLSHKISYYTEMGTTWKDFKRLSKNVSKSFMRSSDKWSLIKIFCQTILFLIFFSLFYLAVFLFLLIKTKDILLSLAIPFLLIIKRILIIYYFIKLWGELK